MRTTIRNLVCAGLLLAASSPARALTIVRTNDASMSDPTIISPADAAAASAAFDYAAGQIMALYSDPVQINIILAATTDPTVLGQSNAPLVGTFTYDQIRTLLINDNIAHPSPDGTTSTAALPAVNPYACTTFLMARGLAKALGNIPSDTTNDGTFTFGTTFTYTYDPANRAVPGSFDFIGVAFHEITELMGRVARLNQTGNCNRPYDVFRFLGAGTQSLIFTDSNVFFSVDGGTTNLKDFNANGNGGDLGDWASGSNDAFNAFSSSGVENDLTPVDVRVMDVIGWDLVPADLSITKTDSPDPVTVGNNLTYTINVTNNGPDTATSVTVTDNLPPETTFVSCSSTGGGVCGGSGNDQTVTFASLASGQSETITFVTNVNCSVADGTVISNTATVSSLTFDPDTTNNSSTTTTTASNPPPTITGAAADPSVLWPPNHRMVNVTVSYDVTDNCPLPFGSCTLSVTSNEPVLGHGSGHTSPDWIVVDDHDVLLRAEREGGGTGRIYTITITCTDSGGNSSEEQVEVTVPHDQGRR